jgi:hypothetical protein
MLQHIKLIDFIERNYASDATGHWYFQNGPQRVFVELESTPRIWRIDPKGGISTNAGLTAMFERCLMDENGWPYLQTSMGFGLVHTQDVAALSAAIERNGWVVEDVIRADLPARYGYCQSPQAQSKENTL